MIEDHNEKYENGLVNYKMGINQFADYSKDEMPSRRWKNILFILLIIW